MRLYDKPISISTETIEWKLESEDSLPVKVRLQDEEILNLNTEIVEYKPEQTDAIIIDDRSGTMNYTDLSNKPMINGVVLVGNKTSEELNLGSGGTGDNISNVQWNNGSISGPTGTINMVSGTAITIPAIPTANINTSGVITTLNQEFSGKKKFADGIIVNSHSTSYWQQHLDYIPEDGEIIIYNDYSQMTVRRLIDGIPQDVTINIPAVKIGYSTAYAIDQPFVGDDIRQSIIEHINDLSVHVTEEEKTFWNNKITCYLDDNNNTILVLSKN